MFLPVGQSRRVRPHAAFALSHVSWVHLERRGLRVWSTVVSATKRRLEYRFHMQGASTHAGGLCFTTASTGSPHPMQVVRRCGLAMVSSKPRMTGPLWSNGRNAPRRGPARLRRREHLDCQSAWASAVEPSR